MKKNEKKEEGEKIKMWLEQQNEENMNCFIFTTNWGLLCENRNQVPFPASFRSYVIAPFCLF
jgi:hypothetical protein